MPGGGTKHFPDMNCLIDNCRDVLTPRQLGLIVQFGYGDLLTSSERERAEPITESEVQTTA